MEGVFSLFGLLMVFVVIAGWVLPWVNRQGIRALRDDQQRLHDRLLQVERKTHSGAWTKSPAKPAAPEQAPQKASTEPTAADTKESAGKIPPASAIPPMTSDISSRPTSVPVSTSDHHEEFFIVEDVPPPEMPARQKPVARKEEKEHGGFEIQLGAKLPVWFGGIALAFAGFYLVKYSIDVGLLTPAVRVILGSIFGLGLLAAGKFVREKENFANGTRIAQALTGAGIADLYVCIFAATSLYDLLAPITGFICMGVVTATAVILSLRHGAPIALLGMVGGFLTPSLMTTAAPSALLLFGYLYFVLAGLMFVIRKQGWWHMGYLAVAGAFVWAVYWLLSGAFGGYDGIWLGLFLTAVCLTILGNPMRAPHPANTGNPVIKTAPRTLQMAAFAGTLALMAVTLAQAHFGIMEWALFGFLSAGGMALAYFRATEYRAIPFATLALNILMLTLWHPVESGTFAVSLLCFASLYALGGHLLQWKAPRPFYWAALSVTAGFTFYALGYAKLHDVYTMYHIWTLIALSLATVATHMVMRVYESFANEHKDRNAMLALYAGAATGFISIGLLIEVPYEFLSVAFALEILALCWIQNRIDIPAMRRIITLVAVGFALLLIPQMIALAQISAWTLLEQKIHAHRSLPLVNWPLFQLGLPALCFMLGGIFLRQKQDGRMVQVFEITAIALLGLAGYYLTRHLLHPGENILFITAGFGERGIITNVIFLFGLLCIAAGRKFDRNAITNSGVTLAFLAIFRIGYFDLLTHNPLWHSSQTIAGVPVFNMLLVTYGLPVLLSAALAKLLLSLDRPKQVAFARMTMFVLAFVLLTFEVRHFFHGEILRGGAVPDAEIYAYSAVWLLFGLLLLFYGVWKKNTLVRKASLAVVILVVGKVFLYDAAALTGLYRVAAFFGLGVSLLGISWFYSRFVFPAPASIAQEDST